MKIYKAYIKEFNVIVDVESVDFENKYITWFDGQYDRSYPEPNKMYEITSFDDCVLLQYSGFCDDRGNKLYEGDIVKSFILHHGISTIDLLNKESRYVVKLVDDEFMLQSLDEKCDDCKLASLIYRISRKGNKEIVVLIKIGNIYEKLD